MLLTADEKIIRIQDDTKREEAAEDRKDIVQGYSHSHCCGWFLVGVLVVSDGTASTTSTSTTSSSHVQVPSQWQWWCPGADKRR